MLITSSFIYGLSFCLNARTASLPDQDLDYVNNLKQTATQNLKNEVSAPEIAKQVTVRILTESGTGSGVIIKRNGQTYTVLTNHHVVADSPEKGFQVLTYDGQMYQAGERSEAKFGKLDLALVEFTSKQNYQVVVLKKSQTISEGETIYAAGFPAWNFTMDGSIIKSFEGTRDWGSRAFKLTTGTLKMQINTGFFGGYKIGYTNEISQGMSGGPMLNEQGELIGINGFLKYPFQGINAFILIDGTVPSEELYQEMEALSWGIPVTTISQLL